jgi:CRISPR/Cas system-associated exonuclease Cas4 (RecB family)
MQANEGGEMIRPLTSASNLLRRQLCPGSANLEAKAPPQIDSDDATEGTMLHAMIAKEDFNVTHLTSDQAYCLRFCRDTVKELEEEHLNTESLTTLIEQELYWERPDNVFGHADLITHDDDLAIVVDYKFGRLPVETAEANMQLRAYACMAASNFGFSNVLAVIIQPRAEGADRITMSIYGAEDFKQARKEIKAILEASKDPKAKRNPTVEGCRYCRAKANCPELSKQTDEIAIVSPKAITVSNAADFYRKAKIVEKHVDAIKSAIFLMVQIAESENRKIPGLTIEPGNKVRKITNAEKAYHSLQHILSPEIFASCCTVKITNLDDAFKKATGKTEKDAKSDLGSILTNAGCLELKQSEGSLVFTDESK